MNVFENMKYELEKIPMENEKLYKDMKGEIGINREELDRGYLIKVKLEAIDEIKKEDQKEIRKNYEYKGMDLHKYGIDRGVTVHGFA